jgi:uncharacterized membrane protein required for colicin V production
MASFNLVDLVFIAFTLIFILTAFLRGFVKEIFSFFNWVVALTLSYVITPYVAQLFSVYSDNKFVIDVSLRIIIFILVFIATALSTSGLCKSLKEKTPDVFDRSLGVFFGVIKTLLIFGFLYSITVNIYGILNKDKSEKVPYWLSQARSHGILKMSGDLVDPVVKKFINAIVVNYEKALPKQKDLDEKIDEIIEKKDDVKDSVKDAKKETKKAVEDSGYSKKDIEKMNRLIDIIDKK